MMGKRATRLTQELWVALLLPSLFPTTSRHEAIQMWARYLSLSCWRWILVSSLPSVGSTNLAAPRNNEEPYNSIFCLLSNPLQSKHPFPKNLLTWKAKDRLQRKGTKGRRLKGWVWSRVLHTAVFHTYVSTACTTGTTCSGKETH